MSMTPDEFCEMLEATMATAPADFADRFVSGVNALLLDEALAIGRLLDWVGVAAMSPQRERVLVLCAEYLSRTGQLPLDEALVMGREVLAAQDAAEGGGGE